MVPIVDGVITWLAEHPDGKEDPPGFSSGWVDKECPECGETPVICTGFGIDRFDFECDECGHDWIEPCSEADQPMNRRPEGR